MFSMDREFIICEKPINCITYFLFAVCCQIGQEILIANKCQFQTQNFFVLLQMLCVTSTFARYM